MYSVRLNITVQYQNPCDFLKQTGSKSESWKPVDSKTIVLYNSPTYLSTHLHPFEPSYSIGYLKEGKRSISWYFSREFSYSYSLQYTTLRMIRKNKLLPWMSAKSESVDDAVPYFASLYTPHRIQTLPFSERMTDLQMKLKMFGTLETNDFSGTLFKLKAMNFEVWHSIYTLIP